MKIVAYLDRIITGLIGGFDRKWSVFCESRNLELHHLTNTELRLVLLTLTSTEKSHTFLFREGWSAWLVLKDARFPISIHRRWFSKVNVPPVLPQMNPVTSITQVKGETKVFRDRHHERHSIELPLRISTHKRDFETITLDISEGGILIRDPLPEWAAGYLYCVIEIAPGEQIALVCSLVEDQDTQKTRLEAVTTQSQSEFLTWLRSDDRFKRTAGAP